MKKLFTVLALVLSLSGISAFAAPIDRNLQAVMLSDLYPAAMAQARVSAAAAAPGYAVTLGDTSTLQIDGPSYFFYIPVIAIRVPLSPADPIHVGDLVAELQMIPNSPGPGVQALYFKPAPEPAR